jgi:mono/diheme cytochrome c family protein
MGLDLKALTVKITLAGLLAATGCITTVDHDVRSASRGVAAVDGREEFLMACAACHGADARGAGPAAPALKTPPGDLTRLAERAGGRFPREHVIAVLSGEVHVTAHGSREMPVWSQRFTPSESGATAAASIYTRRWLEALASYLESIQGSRRSGAV